MRHIHHFLQWTFFAGLLCLSSLKAHSQDWTAPFGSDQVFIENEGQFDKDAFKCGMRADFAIDHGFAWKVFLGGTKVAYLTRKMEWKDPANEDIEGEGRRGIEKNTIIRMEWMGANPGALAMPMKKRSAYYTYSYEKDGDWVNVDHADGYDEIFVSNLYPSIDLTWTAPEDGGVKYALTLHPGADPSKVTMAYIGATPVKDADGNLHMSTVQGDLIDHAPKAWYADNPSETIPVQFKQTGCVISFELAPYDNSRAIVIDPWTVNPAFPLFNRAFEVDADGAGNVFAWGGGMGYNLKKYNSAGTLQWTHVSPWDTSNAWFGELYVLNGGDVFISAGSAAKLRRLTAAGATTFTNNGPFLNLDEYWNMIQNCDFTKLLIGGTRIIGLSNPRSHLFDVSMATGNQLAGSPYRIQIGCSAGFPSACEIRMLNLGADGYIYAVTNDSIYKLNTTFGQVYRVPHGKNLSYYSPSYLANGTQGINGLAAGLSNFYVNWGSELRRYDNATGALLATVAITGGYTSGLFGSGPTASGCAIDNCGNVYVGSNATVNKYNSALVAAGSAAMSSTIYDIHVAPGGAVIVGGNGYVTSNTSLTPCVPVVIVCPVLPATLDGYQADCMQGKGIVSWKSLQEHGCSHFNVEREMNGTWVTIGTVAAKGGDSPAEYSFTDPNALPLGEQEVLYRLQIVDGDGKQESTGIVSLTACDETSQLMIIPSVTKGDFDLTLEQSSAGEYQIKVVDMQGKTVLTHAHNADSGNGKVSLSLEGFATGIYIIHVAGPDGYRATGRVIKE